MAYAVHFGAGNIGRGFIGSILFESGYSTIFADIDEKIIDTLHKQKEYKVKVVGTDGGSEKEEFSVTNIDAVLSSSDTLPRTIADTDLITCAVGPNILNKIAINIARGIEARKAQGNTKVLYIIACENMLRASTALKAYVYDIASESLQEFMNTNVAFLDSAVDRSTR